MQSASTRPDDNIVPPIKVQDIKAARQLASEITQSGAKLFDMLAKEASERQERLLAIRFLDQSSAAGSGVYTIRILNSQPCTKLASRRVAGAGVYREKREGAD